MFNSCGFPIHYYGFSIIFTSKLLQFKMKNVYTSLNPNVTLLFIVQIRKFIMHQTKLFDNSVQFFNEILFSIFMWLYIPIFHYFVN